MAIKFKSKKAPKGTGHHPHPRKKKASARHEKKARAHATKEAANHATLKPKPPPKPLLARKPKHSIRPVPGIVPGG